MADVETTISTPDLSSDTADTANDELTTSDDLETTEELTTSEIAPDTETPPAETETETQEPKLYAGKYSSVEELEKGYGELNKAYTQANQIKAKYDELLKQQQTQQSIELQNAQKAGFNSVEEQEIANKVTLEEFNAFWQNLNSINAEYQPQVQQYLTEYYKTGNKEYLQAAKMYYSADFLERVAVGKKELQSRLQADYENQRTAQKKQHDAQLAEAIKADYADFLADINENTGKGKALKAFCDADFIQSKEDMETFKSIYSEMESYIKAAAIKEYEAQKAIEKTKQAAQIQTDAGIISPDTMPTIEQLEKMNQEDYNKAVAKYGTQKLFSQKV